MRVCLLNDSFPPVLDGVANVVMNYARIMQEKLGAEVLVATPEYPGAEYEGKYPYEVVPYTSLDTTRLVNGYRTGSPLPLKTISRIREFAPDIIHVHCPATSAILGRILRRETGAPIIFTYHTKFDVDIVRAVGEGLLEKKAVEAMVDNISACDEVWAVSDGAGKNLQSLGYRGAYQVVTNGVDFPRGKVPEAQIREVTADYDLPEDVPVFLFVGRMMKYKGLPLILDAMAGLAAAGMDFRMVFIGGGTDAAEMQQKAVSLGLSVDICVEKGGISHTEGSGRGRVIFTGPVHDREQLRAWNSRADLFLFPSTYDTNGIVVGEAAACGLASVLIRDSCAAERIQDGRNGFLIGEDAGELTGLLLELGKNPDRMHEAGRHAMEEVYISWEDNVREVYGKYEEICEAIREELYVTRRDTDDDTWLRAAEGVVRVSERLFGLKADVDAWRDGMRSNTEDFLDRIPDYVRKLRAGVKELGENAMEGVRLLGESTIDGLKELGENVEAGTRQMLGKKDDDRDDTENKDDQDDNDGE